jgi:prenyltransferase, ubiA family
MNCNYSMEKCKNIIQLARPRHYIKNILILLPLFFGGLLFDCGLIVKALIAFTSFSFIASTVYIINDIKDVKNDRRHKTKYKRPIASGAVRIRDAIVAACALFFVSIAINVLAFGINLSLAVLLGYFFINILYSVFGLKNIPIIDVFILSAGFILRIIYGGLALGIPVSKWLYLTIFAFSFYMGLGKRRNELINNKDSTRPVNKFYTKDFLDKNMYVCLTLGIVFYSLWTIAPPYDHSLLFWTIPIVMVIIMNYSLLIEREESEGDPVNVLLGSINLKLLLLLYATTLMGVIYL